MYPPHEISEDWLKSEVKRVAAENSRLTGACVRVQAKAVQGDAALTTALVTAGLDAFPAVVAKSLATPTLVNGSDVVDLIEALAEAARGDAALTTAVITAGLDALPAVAAKSRLATPALVEALAKAAQGDAAPLTTAVITAGLDALPAVAAQNLYAVAALVKVLAKAAQGDAALTTAVITAGLAALPAVAAEHGDTAVDLVRALTESSGVDTAQGFVCREFMFSAPGGRNNRQTIIIFGDTPDQTIARTDCFNSENSPYQQHYKEVPATAFEAIAHCKTLPSFAQSPVSARPAVPANA